FFYIADSVTFDLRQNTEVLGDEYERILASPRLQAPQLLRASAFEKLEEIFGGFSELASPDLGRSEFPHLDNRRQRALRIRDRLGRDHGPPCLPQASESLHRYLDFVFFQHGKKSLDHLRGTLFGQNR